MRKASNTVWRYCLSALAFAAIVNGGKSVAQTSNLPSSENPYTYPSDFTNSLESLVPVYLYFTGGQEGTDGAPGQNGAPIDFYIENLPKTSNGIYNLYAGAQSQGGTGSQG